MTPVQFRTAIMKVLQRTHDDDYWISTNMVDDDLLEQGIMETTTQRVGTNLNILKRLGYVDRLGTANVWKLTPKGVKIDLEHCKL